MNKTDPPPPPQHRRLAHADAPSSPRPEKRFVGMPISRGVAIGPVFGTSEPPAEIVKTKILAADIEAEGARLDAAIVQSRRQLTKLRARLSVLPQEGQDEIAPLIDAYIRMLGPSRLIRGARRRVAETLLSAESAVMAESDEIGSMIMAQADRGMVADDHA